MSTINCPQCASPDVRSQRVVHAEGKSSGGSTTGGLISDFKGHLNLVTGHGSMRMQSDLSKLCAPPNEYDFEDQAVQQVGTPPRIGCGLMLAICAAVHILAILIACMTERTASLHMNETASGILAGTVVLLIIGYWIWFFVALITRANRRNAWRARVAQARQALHAAAMAEYNKSFICLKCGHQFTT